jgi:hypothetical protein
MTFLQAQIETLVFLVPAVLFVAMLVMLERRS